MRVLIIRAVQADVLNVDTFVKIGDLVYFLPELSTFTLSPVSPFVVVGHQLVGKSVDTVAKALQGRLAGVWYNQLQIYQVFGFLSNLFTLQLLEKSVVLLL